MSHHPLIGHAVRVTYADRRPFALVNGVYERRAFGGYTAPLPPFDGTLVSEMPDGRLVVMADPDGGLFTADPTEVRLLDPERAARVLRLHATDNDFRAAGCTVIPEYTPPRWVPAAVVVVGTRVFAVAYPDGRCVPCDPLGAAWREEAREAAALRNGHTWLLVGEWPPLPKEGA